MNASFFVNATFSSSFDWETLFAGYRYGGSWGLYLVRNRWYGPFVSFRQGCVSRACLAASMAPAGQFRRTAHDSATQRHLVGFSACGGAV
jgi:hypothetical protein